MRAAAILVLAAACGRVDFAPRTADGGGDDAGGDVGDGPMAVPAHRYPLAGSYADDFGGPALTPHGGAFTSGGYAFGPNQGLSVDGLLGDAYTIDMQFELADVTSTWRKLVDYSGLVRDEGLYTFSGAMQFVISSGADFETTRAVLTANTPIRMTITRSAAGDVNGYLARVTQPAMRNTVPDPPTGTSPGSKFEFTDTTSAAALTGTATLNFFMDDSGTGMNEATSGEVRQIAIWDRPLTISEIAALP